MLRGYPLNGGRERHGPRGVEMVGGGRGSVGGGRLSLAGGRGIAAATPTSFLARPLPLARVGEGRRGVLVLRRRKYSVIYRGIILCDLEQGKIPIISVKNSTDHTIVLKFSL